MKKLLPILLFLITAKGVSAQDYVLKNLTDRFSISQGTQGINVVGNDIKDNLGNYFLKGNSAIFPDGIVSGCGLTISGSNVIVASGSWRISGVVYTKNTATTLAIDAQDATLSRYDVIYADNTTNLHIVSGSLSATPVYPAIPGGTLLTGAVLITPTSVTAVQPFITGFVDLTTNQTIGGVKTFINGISAGSIGSSNGLSGSAARYAAFGYDVGGGTPSIDFYSGTSYGTYRYNKLYYSDGTHTFAIVAPSTFSGTNAATFRDLSGTVAYLSDITAASTANDTSLVHIAGTETITGDKTFTGNVNVTNYLGAQQLQVSNGVTFTGGNLNLSGGRILNSSAIGIADSYSSGSHAATLQNFGGNVTIGNSTDASGLYIATNNQLYDYNGVNPYLKIASSLTGASYTNANITISSTGKITAISNGTGGGSGPSVNTVIALADSVKATISTAYLPLSFTADQTITPGGHNLFFGNGTFLAGSGAVLASYPNARGIFTQTATGATNSNNIGIVGEAVAITGSKSARGVYGSAKTDGNQEAAGLYGSGVIGNTADAGTAYGVKGFSQGTHAGGNNIALLGTAGGSNTFNIGGFGTGTTTPAGTAFGFYGVANVSASTDAVDARGLYGQATTTHSGGNNIGVYLDASGGANNYAVYANTGSIYFNAALLPNGQAGTSGQVLTSAGVGAVPVWSTPITGGHNHTIFTPTTGGTVILVNNQENIVNPAGTLASLNLTLPSSPANNDVINLTFTQAITAISYSGGTVVGSPASCALGGQWHLTYDSGTSTWY